MLRPLAALVSLYVTALVLVYQYVEWQYRLSPPLSLFLRSYLVKQVTVVCAAIVLLLYLLERLMRPAEVPKSAVPGPAGRPGGRPAGSGGGAEADLGAARRGRLPGRRTLGRWGRSRSSWP